MREYTTLVKTSKTLLEKRGGWSSSEHFEQICEQLASLFQQAAYRAQITDLQPVLTFTDMLQDNELLPIRTDGVVRHFDSVVAPDLLNHKMHRPFSDLAMKWIPNPIQCGKGEALFCVYDVNSTLGISPQLDYDIILQGTKEFKSHKTNLVSPQYYQELIDKCDHLVVVKNMLFTCVETKKWDTILNVRQTPCFEGTDKWTQSLRKDVVYG